MKLAENPLKIQNIVLSTPKNLEHFRNLYCRPIQLFLENKILDLVEDSTVQERMYKVCKICTIHFLNQARLIRKN